MIGHSFLVPSLLLFRFLYSNTIVFYFAIYDSFISLLLSFIDYIQINILSDRTNKKTPDLIPEIFFIKNHSFLNSQLSLGINISSFLFLHLMNTFSKVNLVD